MSPGTSIHRLAIVCLFVAAALALSTTDVFASHFRYGTITWTVANPAKPNVVTLRFESAWRRSYELWLPASPTAVGQVVTTSVANLGQIVVRNSSGAAIAVFMPTLKVTSLNTAEDWFAASYEATVTLPASTATYTATFTACCRISTLRDLNADHDYFVRTAITVKMPPEAVNQPPTSATVPIVTLAKDRPASIQLPASDPNGDAVAFRLSSFEESGLRNAAPQSPAPGAVGAFQLSSTGLVQWTPDTVGLYAVQVRLTDTHGAFSVIDFLLNVVSAQGETPAVFLNDQPVAQKLTVVHGTPVSFTVKATDPENTPVALSSSGLPVGSTMTPSLPLTAINAASTFTWTPAARAIGTYVMSFAALDGAGLQGTNSVTIVVTNNPPVVQCTTNGPDIEATSAAGGLFTISTNVDDIDRDKLTIKFFVDGEEQRLVALLPPPASESLSTPVAIGSHTYEVRVDDGLGTRSCTGTFAVRDTSAPSIVVDPGDQTLAAVSRDGAVATFTVNAHDEVDAEPELTCSHPSGATFPIALTTVTCTATDAAGNRNEASFVINVIDADPPTIDAHPDLTASATSPAGAVVDYQAPATHDAIDGDGVATCVPRSGSTFPLGATTVTCSAVDTFGNQAVDVTFAVTITNHAPTFTAPANISIEATGAAGAIVPYSAIGDDTEQGAIPAICSHTPGSTFALGTTTVLCTVTDVAGASASGSFIVTVQDTTPPAITDVSPSTTRLAQRNHAMEPVTIRVDALDAVTSTPICSIADVTSNEPVNSSGDGNTTTDWQITGPLTLDLRAERSGNGDGRIYSISIGCADSAGNTSTATTMILVPKSATN